MSSLTEVSSVKVHGGEVRTPYSAFYICAQIAQCLFEFQLKVVSRCQYIYHPNQIYFSYALCTGPLTFTMCARAHARLV